MACIMPVLSLLSASNNNSTSGTSATVPPVVPPTEPNVTIPASCQPMIAEAVVDTEWQVEGYNSYEFEAAFDE